MVFISLLVYLKEGQEAAFHEFESKAIPIIYKHGGSLNLRIKPTSETFIEGDWELPDEIHFVSFPDETAFQNFVQDEERKQWIHLQQSSVAKQIFAKAQL